MAKLGFKLVTPRLQSDYESDMLPSVLYKGLNSKFDTQCNIQRFNFVGEKIFTSVLSFLSLFFLSLKSSSELGGRPGRESGSWKKNS